MAERTVPGGTADPVNTVKPSIPLQTEYEKTFLPGSLIDSEAAVIINPAAAPGVLLAAACARAAALKQGMLAWLQDHHADCTLNITMILEPLWHLADELTALQDELARRLSSETKEVA